MTYPYHWFSEQVGLAGDLGSTNDILFPLRGFLGSRGRGVKQKSIKKTGYSNIVASVGRSVDAHGNSTMVESFPTIETTFATSKTSTNQGSGTPSNAMMKTYSSVVEKQVLIEDMLVEVLKMFTTISEAYGIHSPASANEENMKDAGNTMGPTPNGNTSGRCSYANVTNEPSRKALNFHTLYTPAGNGVDVVVPVESIRAINEWFANTAYGFFLGNQVAYPVVANYVRNICAKYRLVKSLVNSSIGMFSFQFRSVKLHDVLVIAFSKDGLSAVATNLGTPLMLDSYKPDMCIQSWGRSSYARALIEVRIDVELKDNIVCTRSGGVSWYGLHYSGLMVGAGDVYRSEERDDVSKKISDSDLVNAMYRSVAKLYEVDLTNTGSKVASVIYEMANFLASKKVKYCTNSLLEQWKETYENDGYDFDPYDDDIYEGQDMPDKIQYICDNLDITIRGSKKK
ncbi:hypothetical protein Tco_1546479 [Tanacetum coccineum]